MRIPGLRSTDTSTSNNSTDNNDNGEQSASRSYSRAQSVGLVLGPFLFAVTLLFFQPEGLSVEGRAVLAITLWIATWWITEAIPIPATSLLPIVLLPVTGALDSATVTSAYGTTSFSCSWVGSSSPPPWRNGICIGAWRWPLSLLWAPAPSAFCWAS